MLFRAILYLIVAIVVITALRSVIGAIVRVLAEMTSPSETAGAGKQTRRPAVPVSESLKQDPVCGMFIAPSTSVQKTIGGTTYYFCSAQCRDRFKPS